ncbi:uncharacterized protein LOC110114037 [Dendrobium catenatum]|uniref:uncharacterized protein LOC110114037 n=1 Tax=Dendrobium catenatum TaxID=906689 RepID=UPI0009F1F891|nr:uncharacterized protein LOC110114037 [Dendrobium catenatum]
MAAADFPPLPSPASSSPTRSSVPPLWKNLLTTTPQISTNFSHSLSFVPTNNFTANFTTDQFVAGAPEWALSLKWSPDLVPKREEFPSIPLWVKILNLPLLFGHRKMLLQRLKPVTHSRVYVCKLLALPLYLKKSSILSTAMSLRFVWPTIGNLNIAHNAAILGDFNSCRELGEKIGGTSLTVSKMGDFNNMVFNAGIHDLSSVGHYFTWHNQQPQNPIHIKLDRILVNNKWLYCFPSSFYKITDPDCSDHSPLILVCSSDYKRGHRFLYKNYCTIFPEFWDCLLEVFSLPNESSPLSSFNFKLKTLKNVMKHKSWTNANQIQRDIDNLKDLQHSVISQIQSNPLDPILNDDLKFLYSKINITKNYNRIKAITNDQGTYTKHADIANVFINHYKNFFNTPASNHLAFDIPAGSLIPSHLTSSLIAPVTMEEIKNIVFLGNSNTAPGPDGFTFDFYRSTWNVLQHQLCRAVSSFFTTGFMPNQIKATAIALIPKQTHATNVKDYRPIALCNVIYKIITKIIANRMKLVMPHIIHPSQGGFIHKRIISDHIILATDILGRFNLKAKHKYLCTKFDITKAFDMVSRDFLYKILEDKGFPSLFISWIKACTSNVHFSICINGVLEGYFNSTSGIRQGCPLSPYLFSVIMDGLSSIFDIATASNSLQAIKVGRCEVSHLMFDDDLLVFCNATVRNAHTIKSIMKDFATVTGLNVNPLKSSILLSKNTPAADDICNILNIQQSISPIKYKGLPIFYRKLRLSDFNPLIQRINSQLEGWKAKTLSLAGRVQFIKFTISNTLAYWIRGSIIPKGCCKQISRLCSRFTFFGNIQERKLVTASWSKTCCPKIYGGLGIPSINSLKHSYACSIIWRFLNADSLLFSWWRANYQSLWKPKTKNNSHYWDYLCVKANEIKNRLTLSVNASSNLSFFWDPWCRGISVADYLMSTNNTSSLSSLFDCTVSQLILADNWNLPNCLDNQMATIILSVLVDNYSEYHLWNNKQNPTFNDFNSQFYENLNVVPWHKYIWHKHNAWMMFNEGLKIADVLTVRGISVPNTCCFCHIDRESITHLFYECSYSFYIARALFPWMHNLFMRPNFHQVFYSICEQESGAVKKSAMETVKLYGFGFWGVSVVPDFSLMSFFQLPGWWFFIVLEVQFIMLDAEENFDRTMMNAEPISATPWMVFWATRGYAHINTQTRF